MSDDSTNRRQDRRITIRLAKALRRELEAEAQAEYRPLGAHIRKILFDRMVARLHVQETPSR